MAEIMKFLMLEHRFGLMEILKNLNRYIFDISHFNPKKLSIFVAI